MDIPALGSLIDKTNGTPGTTPSSPARAPKKELDQTDFLRLLMTQLQFQDPLKPMENQEFTAQLTSFNSLNQLVDLNKKMGAMQDSQLAVTQLQATSLIGKEVTMQGDKVHLGPEGKAETIFQLAAESGRVSVHVVAKDGAVIRMIEAGSLKAGEHVVAWDGKDDKGNAAPEGDYTIEIDAFDTQGKEVAVETLIKGVVTSVDLAGAELSVMINGVQVPFSALLAVRTPPSNA